MEKWRTGIKILDLRFKIGKNKKYIWRKNGWKVRKGGKISSSSEEMTYRKYRGFGFCLVEKWVKLVEKNVDKFLKLWKSIWGKFRTGI